MNARRIVLLVLLLVVGFLGTLFTLQNGGRMSGLSLSLGFTGAAFQLKEPVAVPWLMWSALGVGLLVGGAWGLWQRISLGSQIRDLQQKLARAKASSSKDAWGA